MKKVMLVDLNNKKIGEMEKLEAHTRPHLHRAFSVFLISDGKMLIQKRADCKYHSPGLWANSCCSHPLSDNLEEEANERMREELGIKEFVPLKKIFDFVYMHKFNDNLFEYELDNVLVGNYSGKVTLNPEEASEFCWISFEDLAKQLEKEPEKFSSWFIICAPQVLKYLNSNY